MSKQPESNDSPELQAKLKSIGFEQTEFEPKSIKRFIVTVDGLPSYVINDVHLPDFQSNEWTGEVTLKLYNPLRLNLEQTVIDLVKKSDVKVVVKVLSPVGAVDTIWDISTVNQSGRVWFGRLDWSVVENDFHYFSVSFKVSDVKFTYPTDA
jgi:hypothetical protein